MLYATLRLKTAFPLDGETVQFVSATNNFAAMDSGDDRYIMITTPRGKTVLVPVSDVQYAVAATGPMAPSAPAKLKAA